MAESNEMFTRLSEMYFRGSFIGAQAENNYDSLEKLSPCYPVVYDTSRNTSVPLLFTFTQNELFNSESVPKTGLLPLANPGSSSIVSRGRMMLTKVHDFRTLHPTASPKLSASRYN